MLVADAVGRSSAGPLAGGRCGYLPTLRWLLLWALACLTSAIKHFRGEFELGMKTPAWELFPYERSALFAPATQGAHA